MSTSLRLPALAGLLLMLVLPAAQGQGASERYYDPPGRVAYVNHSEGGIGFSPAGEEIWLDMTRNRPMSRGDRLWTGRDARMELQIGSAMLRLDAETSLEILELDDRISQLLVSEGVLNLSVQRMQRDEHFEIATPNLAFSIDRPGRYRIDVDPRRDETTIVVWEGAGEVYGDGATFPLRAGDTVRFRGYDLRDYQVFGLPRTDRFDRYCLERDRQLARSPSLRYVDAGMIGYASLDAHGSWRAVSGHGHVWFPARVERDWAPYRDGHWVWREPWGWTWIDHAPWGFAPSHYGRWVYVSNRWGWVPGPRNLRPVYAPALVAFVGGSRWSLSVSMGSGSPIGWFPLAPREVYVPPYRASRDYFSRVNVTNTVINTTVINNTYNNYSSGSLGIAQVNHANRSISGAVTAVPSEVFVNARPVRQQALRMESGSMLDAEILRVAGAAPDQRSVRGAAPVAQTRPARDVFDRRVIARTPPPAAESAISARGQDPRSGQGRPAQRAQAQAGPRELPSRANVRVVQPTDRAINAREFDSRSGGPRPDAAPAQRRPLDRAQEAGRPISAEPAARQSDAPAMRQPRQQDEERQRQDAAREQQSAGQREAAGQRQRAIEAEQQRGQAAERQRQAESREQQAEAQRQAAGQRQRAVETEQQRGQAAERQRQVERIEQERERGAAESRSARPQPIPVETGLPPPTSNPRAGRRLLDEDNDRDEDDDKDEDENEVRDRNKRKDDSGSQEHRA